MLGENIIHQRKRLGLSQQALADQLHVVRQTISKWEKNLSVPDAEALTRLADALETTVQELLGLPQESAAPESPDMAASLARINEQLAIQNRRRHRLWVAVAWIAGVIVAINALLIILGWAAFVDAGSVQESVAVEASVTQLAE